MKAQIPWAIWKQPAIFAIALISATSAAIAGEQLSVFTYQPYDDRDAGSQDHTGLLIVPRPMSCNSAICLQSRIGQITAPLMVEHRSGPIDTNPASTDGVQVHIQELSEWKNDAVDTPCYIEVDLTSSTLNQIATENSSERDYTADDVVASTFYSALLTATNDLPATVTLRVKAPRKAARKFNAFNTTVHWLTLTRQLREGALNGYALTPYKAGGWLCERPDRAKQRE